MPDYKALEKEISNRTEVIWDMAYNLWKFAELGFEEVKSSPLLASVLEKEGFKITDRGIGGIDTAWVATYGSGSPVIGMLTEYDALPGLGNETVPTKKAREDGITSGHGCGHNLIGAGAVGAALGLKAQMEKEKIPGTLKVFGCPAEELLAGKNYMAQAGAFKDLDICLHHHAGPINMAMNVHCTAAMDLTIEWEGVSAHAGQAPWDGRSSVQAAELFLTAVNMMREHVLPTARMHYYIADGGHAVNVVPDYAKIVFRYRGPSAQNVRDHIKWIREIAQGAALCTQTKETVTVLSGIYDLLPNDVLADRMTEHLKRHFPIAWTEEEHAFAKAIQKEMGKPEQGMATSVLPTPHNVEAGGSTDVGDISWNTPTMGAAFSSWPLNIAPHQWGCTACHGMSIGKKGVVQAAQAMASLGLEVMTDAEIRKAAKAEFDERTNGIVYESLNEVATPPYEAAHRHPEQCDCVIHGAVEHADK